MQTGTRTIDCGGCEAPVTFETEAKWTRGRKIICENCGHVCIDHTIGERIAEERMSLEAAQEIIAPYTFDEIQSMAERGYADPASVTPHEMEVVTAFVRMRAAKENRH
jgi:hypothetical protein